MAYAPETQQQRDFDEYQRGLQGTPTGSLYNQQGLQDRSAPGRSGRTQPKKKVKPGKMSNAPQTKEDWSGAWATLGFLIAAGTVLSQSANPEESWLPALFAGAIGAFILGRFYKAILGITAVVVVLALFVNSGN